MNAEDQNLGEPYECENAEQQEKFPAQQNPSSTQVEAILESENYSAFEIGDDAGGFTKNNTYVSNSENDDDVLVTRDPIPVIFHRITSEIRINSDATSCLSIKTKLQNDRTQDSRLNSAIEEDSEGDNDSEEFYYGGQVNYDGELHKHPQLEADLAAVRELYGSNAVSLSLLSEGALNSVRVCVLLHSLPYGTCPENDNWEYGAIDDVDIDLHIDVSFLDLPFADDLQPKFQAAITLDTLFLVKHQQVPTVDVFQVSTKDRFGLGHQLKKIMQTFVTQQWKNQSKEKLVCPYSKKLPEKKVKSPLHIFSTLRRSPSYPPPGSGKSKTKLKPDQDGMTKSHKLLRRTCSSAVKTEDGCMNKSHKPLGRSLSSDPRAEQTLALKPHKLLNRTCSASVKQDDCASLKPHKLLSRSCSGDPRCEHNNNSTLKPHKLLSRSCSSTIRTEELDGLKHHKLLSRSYSSNTKVGKAEPFKEHDSEGRRLSLTSGLIGILTPSISYQPVQNDTSKSVPASEHGFLVQTVQYAEQRIPILNEYCVVCDEPHVFQNGPMLRPTVCERELCVFAFQTLGVMNEAADEIATGAQVVDLLVSMCRSALESPRKVVIFEPYPSVVDPNDSQTLAFNPRKKDYDRVMRALDSLTSIREMTQQLKFMHTPHQFLLLSSPPAKESNFRAAKKLFGRMNKKQQKVASKDEVTSSNRTNASVQNMRSIIRLHDTCLSDFSSREQIALFVWISHVVCLDRHDGGVHEGRLLK
ncbi:PARP8 polymerase, partial [Polypterus senegalus]|nr:PARP8 polymerase [Polypterus senegalus]